MLRELNHEEIMSVNGGGAVATFLIGAIVGGIVYDVTKKVAIAYVNQPYTRIVTRGGQKYLVTYDGFSGI